MSQDLKEAGKEPDGNLSRNTSGRNNSKWQGLEVRGAQWCLRSHFVLAGAERAKGRVVPGEVKGKRGEVL